MNLQEFAKEILPVVQAAANGKDVQFRGRHQTSEWLVRRSSDPTMYFVDHCEYRIKPDPKLRPYTREEFIEKCLGKVLRNKHTRYMECIPTCLDEDNWYAPPNFSWTLADTLSDWIHLDGSPCGVEVQE